MSRDVLGWSSEDYAALVEMANDQGSPADWFAAVMYRESDFKPSALNALGFRGLIQFSVSNLETMFRLSETQIANFTKLTPKQQLRYVGRYYKAWRPLDGWINRAQLYQATYMPGTIQFKGSANSTVLAKKGELNYNANLSLDPKKKGFITVQDLEDVIQLRIDRSDSQWPTILEGINAVSGQDATVVANLENLGVIK